MLKYAVSLGLLTALFATGLAAQHSFAPFTVTNLTTTAQPTAMSVGAVPAGTYTTFTVTVAWSVGAGDPWSNEARLSLTNGSGTFYYTEAGPTSGGLSSTASTTLTWTGTLAGGYVAGTPLTLVARQTYDTGSHSTWSNVSLTISGAGGGGSYAPPTYTNPGATGDYLARIQINTTPAFDSGTITDRATDHVYHTGVGATFVPGTAYTMTLTNNPSWSSAVGAWIDYNGDGIYQAGEYLGTSSMSAGATGTINFTVPAGTTPIASTRFRVVQAFSTTTVVDNPTGTYAYGQSEEYDATIGAPAANDVGVTAVTAPTTGPGLTATETVTVTIQNFGTGTQTSIPVSFTVNAGTPVNETWTGSLAGGASTTYSFTATANLSTPNTTYTIVARTNLGGDATPGNDSTTVNVDHIGTVTVPALIDFESGAAGWTTGGTNAALWQLGTPSAVGPATAYSGSNAWGTNISGNYGIDNAQAYLISPMIDLTGAAEPRISFYHYMHAEGTTTAWDGGTIQISVNGGTFTSLSNTDPGFIQNAPNMANIVGTGAPGWGLTATASTWQQVIIDLLNLTSVTVTAGDDVQVRFWFGSDSSNAAFPGWYIDDFEVYDGAAPELEVRRSGVIASGATDALGAMTTGSMVPYTWEFHNVGTLGLNITNVNITVNSGSVTAVPTATPSGTIAAGSSDDLDLNITPTADGAFQFTITITSNDPTNPTYTVIVTGTGTSNAAPAVTAQGNWVAISPTEFELVLDPADTFNDTLLVTDSDADDMTVTVTNPTTGISGLTNQPATNATPSGGATGITLLWAGVAQANNTPGDYEWSIVIDDQQGGITTFVARITIVDVPPTHAIANASGGDGLAAGTAYTAEYTVSMSGAADIDLASVSDDNTLQTISVGNVAPSTTDFVFSIAGGFLNLAPNGVLAAGAAGVHSFTVTITDGTNNVSVFVEITVAPMPSFTATSPLTNGEQGQSYGPVSIVATGGTGTLTFSAQSALPTGMSLSNTGALSGVPSVNGAFTITVRITDDLGVFTEDDFDITIDAPATGTPVIDNTSPLPAGTVNQAYGPVNFTATGGAGGNSFAVTGGALPTGMTLSAAGVLSGTPTASGLFTFTVTVTDSVFVSSQAVFDLTINLSGGGGGGGGGSGGGGGCAGQSHTGYAWLALLALLGGVAVLRTRKA